jgi:hypothetical protein
MCVIVLKNPDVPLTEDQIKKMWDANGDGAGVVWWEYDKNKNLKLNGEKGIMTLPELLTVYKGLERSQVFLHLRIATHGKKIPELTHPFGVVADKEKSILADDCDTLIMHNGVLREYGEDTTSEMSDTLDFTTSVLAHIPGFKEQARLLDSFVSKFALITQAPEPKYMLIGGFETVAGLKCSNSFWDRGGSRWEPGRTYNPTTKEWDDSPRCGYSRFTPARVTTPPARVTTPTTTGTEPVKLTKKERKRLARERVRDTVRDNRLSLVNGTGGGHRPLTDVQKVIQSLRGNQQPLSGILTDEDREALRETDSWYIPGTNGKGPH